MFSDFKERTWDRLAVIERRLSQIDDAILFPLFGGRRSLADDRLAEAIASTEQAKKSLKHLQSVYLTLSKEHALLLDYLDLEIITQNGQKVQPKKKGKK